MGEGGDADVSRLLRALAPEVLDVVVRRYRDFSAAEDAVQEALIAAAREWPARGLPDSPRAWLCSVAARRIADHARAEAARRRRERMVVSLVPLDEQVALAADLEGGDRDDTLDLFFMCCRPELSPASAVALTLRALGGLTTSEIARAFHVPEATMAQRIARAKRTLQESGGSLAEPGDAERASRLSAVLRVLYLIFNEGYAASAGPELARTDLSDEAIRLARLLCELAPADAEVEGLLALMVLTDARRAARTGPSGELVPLDEQDRARWDRAKIAEGSALLERALARGAPGPYQVQAAIAALHDQAPSFEETDWAQILALYGVLCAVADSPMARLAHAIALAMVEGATVGLARLDELARDPRLAASHRLDAARAHLLERAGELALAAEFYRSAARRTTSVPERDYLALRGARVGRR